MCVWGGGGGEGVRAVVGLKTRLFSSDNLPEKGRDSRNIREGEEERETDRQKERERDRETERDRE